jgi:hypothetical protein
MKNKLTLNRLIGLVILWQFTILLLKWLTIQSFPFEPTFPYAHDLIDHYGHRLLTTNAFFDGVHYLTIALKGYEGTGLIQAFFPLYPMVLHVFSIGGVLNPVIIGTLISTCCLVAALIVLKKLLILEKETDSTILWTFIFILSSPTAFFWGMVYSESLFLLLSVLSFYWAKKERWWLAGFAGMGAAMTRITGVFIFLGLVWQYHQKQKKFQFNTVSVLLPIVGLGIYMAYLYFTFGDALMFFNVQSEFGGGRETGRLILLYQVLYRYLKMLVSIPLQSWAYYQVLLELISAIFAMVGLVISYFKLPRAYFWYALPAFVLPTLTGTFSSMPRYILVIFPIYWALAKISSHRIRWIMVIIGILLQVINVWLFAQGKWVA